MGCGSRLAHVLLLRRQRFRSERHLPRGYSFVWTSGVHERTLDVLTWRGDSHPVARHSCGARRRSVASGVRSRRAVTLIGERRRNDSQPGFDQPALLVTSDQVRSWRVLSDPSTGILANQILAVKGRGLLYCFLDGGMNQGTGELGSSLSQGSSWTLMSRANEGGNLQGTIGDFDQTLYANASGSMIFSAIGSAGGGVPQH